MNNVHKSYVREILKVTERPEVISFAGGLPNPTLFPIEQIMNASSKVLHNDGEKVLQYSTTEGYLPLREYIAKRYYNDTCVKADNILITNGSQQAIDLISKAFLDKGDTVLIEKPGYLGAIQVFSMFEAKITTVKLNDDGVDVIELDKVLASEKPKLFYTVTNFQNPTGITYSLENRRQVAKILKKYSTIMIDDNPYGELRFRGENIPNMKCFLGNQVISLGSFSKIFAPAMRLGWLCASDEIMEKIIVLKQASDLHTNYFSQRVLYQYLLDNNIDAHINNIANEYKKRRNYMLDKIKEYMPKEIKTTEPDGGMFLWMTLPENISVLSLLNKASNKNVVFVPGLPFYISATDDPGNTLRLNYTNSSKEEIDFGVKSLAEAMEELIKENGLK